MRARIVTIAVSMLYIIFKCHDPLFSLLTLAMIAYDAPFPHDIVLLLVLEVGKSCPFSISMTPRSSKLLVEDESAGVVVTVDYERSPWSSKSHPVLLPT